MLYTTEIQEMKKRTKEKLHKFMKAGELTRVIRKVLLEVSEKTDSKLDEIEQKEKEKQEHLEKKLKKMRERDPFIYD